MYNLDVIISVGYRVKSHRGTSFISSLIRSAKEQVVLVDNYCDDRTLTLLDKRSIGVSCVVHTTYDKTIEDALLIHNAQYPPIHRV